MHTALKKSASNFHLEKVAQTKDNTWFIQKILIVARNSKILLLRRRTQGLELEEDVLPFAHAFLFLCEPPGLMCAGCWTMFSG